ncbi:MAG: hypothetical protein WCV72_04915 [Patescibacteria group bacterium]
MAKTAQKAKTRKCFLHSAWLPFLFWLIFAGLYYFCAYDLMAIKHADIANSQVTEIFSKYSIYTGLAAGFLSLLGGYAVYLILKITKLKKFSLSYPLLAALMALPWYLFARDALLENKYTDIARATTYYIAEPLLSTTKFLFGLIVIWVLILVVKLILKKGLGKNSGTLAAILILPFFLSGCGTINEWACSFFDNPDHCLQNNAIQDANPDACAKIKGADFEDTGSNPPRDKCYLKIAENTGDLGVCDKIEGGIYSYTKAECILSTAIKFENPSGCKMLTGSDKAQCVTAVSPSVTSGSVIEIDEQIDFLKNELKKGDDPELQKQLAGLESKKSDYLDVMNANNKKDYESLSDPLNKQAAVDYASGKLDQKSKDTLVELNNRLRDQGNSMTEKEYQTMRDLLAYKNDPNNNIENMDDAELLKLRWDEKLGNAKDYLKFWNSNPTEKEKKYDEQLLFYERMLERQAAIEKGLNQQQQDSARELDRVTGYIKDQVLEKVTDEAKKQAFGELMDLVESDAAAPVAAILGEAIDTVKKEAKSAEFRGLVRAYNLGMQEELAKAGGDVDKAHAAVTKNLQDDPYKYEDSHTFAHYQNLLENKDCDGTNPHCISRDVFWKAMKKSYKYQNS